MTDPTCSIDGCQHPVRIKKHQLCATHYAYRYQRREEPDRLPARPHRMPPITEPLEHVEVDAATNCWNWQGKIRPNGYGRWGKFYAHRVYWELHRGPIPEGLTIDHLCRNVRCVNPDHLEVVTGRVNTHRSDGPGALNYRKTHCNKGHEFTEENTVHRVTRGRPWRECRECKSVWRATTEARQAG